MAAPTQQVNSNYRPELDGLRALAILAVLLNHCDARLAPGGFLGVDLFFVISGYVITRSLESRQYDHITPFLLEFYQRRIQRLWPALIVVISIGSILICLVNPSPGTSLQTGLAALFGLSNLALYRFETDYFASSTELNIFTHTWSLGVEEQFYLLFPLIFWLTGLGRRDKGAKARFTVTLGILCVSSMVAFILLNKTNPKAAFFLLPARFWELGVGSLTCLWQKPFTDLKPSIIGRRSRLSLSALATIVVCFCLPSSYSLISTISIVLSSAILISCMQRHDSLFILFSAKPLRWIGLISYSLYLWHWPVLSLSRWTLGVNSQTLPVLLPTIFLLAWLSTYCLEKPLRLTSWSESSLMTIAYGLIASAITSLEVITLGRSLSTHLFVGQRNRLSESFQSQPIAHIEICNLFETPLNTSLSASRCGWEAPPGRPTVYILGDSHIHQFGSAIGAYARKQHLGFVGVWGNACAFPPLPASGYSGKARMLTCIAAQEDVKRNLEELIRPGDLVFIGNYLTAYFRPVGEVHIPENARTLYIHSWQSLTEKLVAKGATVIIYLNAPNFPGLEGVSEGFCFPQWYKPNLSQACRINAKIFQSKRSQDLAWIYRWADGKQKRIWDGIDPSSCDDQFCHATHYKDETHFLDYYAAYIFERFIKQQRHPLILSHARPSLPAR